MSLTRAEVEQAVEQAIYNFLYGDEDGNKPDKQFKEHFVDAVLQFSEAHDAALREELGNQQWQHAACLTIAEGTTGWDIPTANDSLAMTTVRWRAC